MPEYEMSVTRTKKRKLCMRLFKPDPDEVCPITQEPILTSELDFLKGVPFSYEHADHSGLELACGHKFAAIPLTYHWVRNSTLQCPLCRAGCASGMPTLNKLPCHFGPQMRKRARKEKKQDKQEQIDSDEVMARQMLNNSIPFPRSIFSLAERVCCVIVGKDETGYMTNCLTLLDDLHCSFYAAFRRDLFAEESEVKIFCVNGLPSNEIRFPPSKWTSLRDAPLIDIATVGENRVLYQVEMDGDLIRVQCIVQHATMLTLHGEYIPAPILT